MQPTTVTLDLPWSPPFEELLLTAFDADTSARLGGPPWLATRRSSAADRLDGLAMPTEAEELWRYSGIDHFSLEPFAPVTARSAATDLGWVRDLADSLGARAGLVVTVDGAAVVCEVDDDGPVVQAAASASPVGGDEPAPLVGHDAESTDAFAVLHQAFVPDVVTVRAPKGSVHRAPVVVVHVVGPASDGRAACFPHTVVRVEPGAQCSVLEVLVAAGDAAALVVPVSELLVEDAAHLAFVSLQVLDGGAVHVGTHRSTVGRDAELRSLAVGFGGSYSRLRTDSALVGQGGRTSLLAAYLGTGTQVHDFRTLQDHQAPRTESELLFTGAVADTARSVYSGLIRIRHGARRADARQTNNNLVLSQGAHADSVPNLDIDENDVRCSHASRVGPIDDEQRWYLESRGVEPDDAERLIVHGFFADMAARAPLPGVHDFISQQVERRLGGSLGTGNGHG